MDFASQVSIADLLSISCLLLKEAMQHINEIRKQPVQSKWKGKDDPLTIADIHSQTILIKGLTHYFPSIQIVAEEEEIDPSFHPSLPPSSSILPPSSLPSSFNSSLLPLSSLTAFIDPLDGTLSFVNGDLDSVTVLLGFACNGKPIIGLIGKIWEPSTDPIPEEISQKESSFPQSSTITVKGQPNKFVYKPKIFLGWTGAGSIFCLEEGGLRELEKPRKREEFVLTISKNKGRIESEEKVKALGGDRVVILGATGNKYLAVINGEADCYYYDLEVDGTKRWDTCAGEALIRCFGGASTNKDGEEYYYSKGSEVQNLRGIVAMLDIEKHEKIIKITTKF